MSASLSSITPEGRESWTICSTSFALLRRRFDLENLVESGINEDVLQMPVDARESKRASRHHQAFLRLQQHAKTGARDVLQAAAIQGHFAIDLIEKRLGRRRLSGIETPGNDYATVGAEINLEHSYSLRSFRHRKPPVSDVSFET